MKLGLRLSDSIRDEPILIDHLIRVATLAINLQTVREGLVRHAWSEAQLSELEAYFKAVNILAEYKLAMRGERACSVSGLDFLRRQGASSHALCYIGDEEAGWIANTAIGLIPSGWFYQNLLVISQVLQDFTLPAVDEQVRRVLPELTTKGEHAMLETCAGPYTFVAKHLMGALEKPVRKSARMQTYVDATRVACALERYRQATGGLADTLVPVVPRFIESIPSDVMDGQPLRYRRLSDGGYLLYSVGWNKTDDGGVLGWTKAEKHPSVDLTQGDWVWQMAARLERPASGH